MVGRDGRKPFCFYYWLPPPQDLTHTSYLLGGMLTQSPITHTRTHTQTHTPLPPALSTPSQRLWPCAISFFKLAPIQLSSTQPTVSESQPQKAWPSSHETAACTELLIPCRVASVLDVSCRAVSYSSFALTRTPPNTPLHPVHGGPNRRASLHRR